MQVNAGEKLLHTVGIVSSSLAGLNASDIDLSTIPEHCDLGALDKKLKILQEEIEAMSRESSETKVIERKEVEEVLKKRSDENKREVPDRPNLQEKDAKNLAAFNAVHAGGERDYISTQIRTAGSGMRKVADAVQGVAKESIVRLAEILKKNERLQRENNFLKLQDANILDMMTEETYKLLGGSQKKQHDKSTLNTNNVLENSQLWVTLSNLERNLEEYTSKKRRIAQPHPAARVRTITLLAYQIGYINKLLNEAMYKIMSSAIPFPEHIHTNESETTTTTAKEAVTASVVIAGRIVLEQPWWVQLGHAIASPFWFCNHGDDQVSSRSVESARVAWTSKPYIRPVESEQKKCCLFNCV